MELAKTLLPIIFGARIPDAGRKLAAFGSGIVLTVGVNLMYDKLGCWIQELEAEAQKLEAEIEHETQRVSRTVVQEEQSIESKIEDINQKAERKVGKN